MFVSRAIVAQAFALNGVFDQRCIEGLEVDVTTREQALARLPGRRDWTGFAASSCDKEDRVRHLLEARLDRVAGDRLVFEFTADGFLKYMVRNIVGTLLEIGGGRMAADTIERVLVTGDRNLAGPTAAARGLCLTRVRYADDG